MKKASWMLCALGLLIVMLLGWLTYSKKMEQSSTEDETAISHKPFMEQTAPEADTADDGAAEQTPDEDEIIINIVHVTEQPLSEINTEDSDCFANRYNVSQPFFDGDNDMYYYCIFPKGDSASDYLYYDNGVDEPTNADVPEIDDFKVHIIIDETIYGIEYDRSDWYSAYITRYKDGVGERLTDDPVEGCYFAEEGIYYQIENKINLMDYNGQNSKPIVEIPDELYSDEGSPKFIVYRGNLWYCYDRDVKDHYYPLWCYDFDKTFTRFDNGGLDAVNNGYFYYKVMDSEYRNKLYRFNCETYTTELVCDEIDVLAYSFGKNYVFCTTYDDNGGLYRINTNENKKILSPDQLGSSEYISIISCSDERIFVTGDSGLFYTCLAEIDIDGNIIRIIC